MIQTQVSRDRKSEPYLCAMVLTPPPGAGGRRPLSYLLFGPLSSISFSVNQTQLSEAAAWKNFVPEN